MSTHEQYRLGITAYSAGDYEQAIRRLTPVAAGQSNGTASTARYYLAQAHMRLAMRHFESRRFPDATRHFQAAARLNPTGADYARFLADCYAAAGDFELAGRELAGALDAEPDDAAIRIKLALALWQQGNPTEAQAVLREGVRRQPLHAELHYQLGILYAAEDNLIEAERLFERTLRLDPSHAGAYERLAQCYALVSRFERALSYLQRAHRIDPSNPRIALQLNLLAQSMMGSDQHIQVEWRRPASPRRDPAGIERLGEAILREPEFVEAFLSLPETDVDAEVFSTLAAVLERTLQKKPEYADLHYHCGAVYRRLGWHDAAVRHAERAVELNGRYINALILLADLYGRTDRWRDGVGRLEQAIQAGADYPDVHYLMGRLFQTGGELDRARRAYARALELNGNYKAAKEALTALAA